MMQQIEIDMGLFCGRPWRIVISSGPTPRRDAVLEAHELKAYAERLLQIVQAGLELQAPIVSGVAP